MLKKHPDLISSSSSQTINQPLVFKMQASGGRKQHTGSRDDHDQEKREEGKGWRALI